MRSRHTFNSIPKTIVSQLSPQDLRGFRHWFTEFDAEAATGKLDKLAEKALKLLREANCTKILLGFGSDTIPNITKKF